MTLISGKDSAWRLPGTDEAREVENIPAANLNVLLCNFFTDVKEKDGGVYEPASLTSFQKSIQR